MTLYSSFFKTRKSRTSILNKFKPSLYSKYKINWHYIVAIIISTIFIFLIYEIWQGLNYSIWDRDQQLTLVLEKNNRIAYLKIDRQLAEVKLWQFPENTTIHLAKGYGDYQISKIKPLAKQEKINYGSLLSQSMTQYLGVLTDAYIVNLGGRADQWLLNEIFLKILLRQGKSNLIDWDIIRILFYLSSLRYEQIEIIDVTQTKAFSKLTLPDKSQVYKANFDILDKLVFKDMVNQSFVNQDLTWEIYNATNHDGLANLFKRIVANSGFNVVGVRQASENFEESRIETSPEFADNSALRKIAAYFKIPIKKNSQLLNDASDVKVFLGEDFWQSCCRK